MIDPRFIALSDWAAQMSIDLEGFGTVPRLDNPDNWQDWAQRVISANPGLQFAAPDPRDFTDWREWAARFLSAIAP